MTLLRLLCFVLILFGGIIMTITAWQYHKMLRGCFADRSFCSVFEFISQFVLLFFVSAYMVGGAYVLLREPEAIYLFVAIVFFVGALFISAMINLQKSLKASLHDKTIETTLKFITSIRSRHDDEVSKTACVGLFLEGCRSMRRIWR